MERGRDLIRCRERCAIDKDGNGGEPAGQPRLDLQADHVRRVEEPRPVLRIGPSGPDKHEEDVAAREGVRNRVEESLPGRDRVDVEEEVFRAVLVGKPLPDATGGLLRIGATVG
jgi:hypothetical protein